jgi:hypothetical protein
MNSLILKSIEIQLNRIRTGEKDLFFETVEMFNDAFDVIYSENDFSIFSMLLYQNHRKNFLDLCDPSIVTRIPNFYSDDLLQHRFSLDPSSYSVVVGLAISKLKMGDRARAKQLFERVANSGYKESTLAKTFLSQFFNVKT